jgi:hypothetical protein
MIVSMVVSQFLRITPVVAWSPDLFVIDPAPLLPTVDRLRRRGGREAVARCPSRRDADQAATWLIDRLSRLAPYVSFDTRIEPGGGQFLLVLERA